MSDTFPITENDRRTVISATAGQTALAGDFPLQDDDDLRIVKTTASGVESTLALTTHYTLSGVGESSGFTATLLTAAAAGDVYQLDGRAVLKRLTSIVADGRFKRKPQDNEHDRHRLISQELRRDVDKAWTTKHGVTPPRLVEALTEGRVPVVDAAGHIVNSDFNVDDLENAETNAEEAKAARDIAVASAAAYNVVNATGGDLDDALESFFAGLYRDGKLPTGTIEGASIELQDGDRFRLELGSLARLKLTGASPALHIYTLPVWTRTVSLITDTTGLNLVEPGNTAVSINKAAVLTVSSAVTVKRGELLKIVSDDEVVGTRRDSVSVVCREGEFVMAALDSTGTEITLTAPLKGTYTTAIRIFKVANAAVEIVGGVGDYDDAITIGSNAPILKLTGLVGCRVQNWEALRAVTRGVQMVGCYQTTIASSRGANHKNNGAQSNYGYIFDVAACTDTTITGLAAHHVRHGVTTNNQNVAAGATGIDLHKQGRTRGFNVANSAGRFCENSAFDVHDDVDGALFSNVSVMDGFAGAESEGAGLSARGRNVLYSNCLVDNCLAGVVSFTQKNGRFDDCTVRRSRRFAIAVDSGNIATNEDQEAIFNGGYYEVVNPTDVSVVRLEAMTGKTARVELVGGLKLVAAGNVSALTGIINIRTPGVDLLLDCVVDLTGITTQGSLDLFRIEDAVGDDVKIRGRVRIIGGSASLRRAFHQAANNTCSGDIELEIDYQGDNDFSEATAGTANPFGLVAGKFPTARLMGKALGADDRYSRDYTLSVAPGDEIAVGGWLDDVVTVNLVPSGNCTGANALTVDTTNIKDAQIFRIRNNSDYVVQLTGNANVTIAPRNTVVFHTPDYSTSPFLELAARGDIPGQITKSATYSTAARDHGALLRLDNAANTQDVVLAPTSPVGTVIETLQVGSGYWTFTTSGSGSIVTRTGNLKTNGQWSQQRAEVIENSGGSAAVWLLSGSLTS